MSAEDQPQRVRTTNVFINSSTSYAKFLLRLIPHCAGHSRAPGFASPQLFQTLPKIPRTPSPRPPREAFFAGNAREDFVFQARHPNQQAKIPCLIQI